MAAKPVRIAFLDGDGNAIETMPLDERGATNPFKSGAVGYMATGKTVLRSNAGETTKFQVSCSVVEIGSQNEALAEVAAELRSRKEQLNAQIAELREKAKHLA